MTTMEEDYNKRLDADLSVLEENLALLIQNAAVTLPTIDHYGNERNDPKSSLRIQQEHLAIDGASENIIRACQSLLGMTTHLRTALITNDFHSFNAQLKLRKNTLNHQQDINTTQLALFVKDLKETIHVLDDALQQS